MKINKIIFFFLLSLYGTKNYAMDIKQSHTPLYNPTFEATLLNLNLEKELINQKTMSLYVSPTGNYILININNILYLIDETKISLNQDVIDIEKYAINHYTKDPNQLLKEPVRITMTEHNNELFITSAYNLKNDQVLITVQKITDTNKTIIYQKTICGYISCLKINKLGNLLILAEKQSSSLFSVNLINKEIKIEKISIPNLSNFHISSLEFDSDNNLLISGNKNTLLVYNKEQQNYVKKKINEVTSTIIQITYLKNKKIILLATQDGDIIFLDEKGDFIKKIYSPYFGKNKTYKCDQALLAPYSFAILFYLTHLDKNDSIKQLSCIEMQVENNIYTLHANNFKSIFFYKFKDKYSIFGQGQLLAIGLSDLFHNNYTISAISTDSKIYIWKISIPNKSKSPRPNPPLLRNSDTTYTEQKYNQARTNNKQKFIYKISDTTNHQLTRQLTKEELIQEVKTEKLNKKATFDKYNSVIIPKKNLKKSKKRASRSYSADTGIQIFQQQTSIIEILKKNMNSTTKLNMLNNLLDTKNIINERDDSGNTPLHYAIQIGNINIIKLLLKKHANPNIKNNDGISPLHNAVQDCKTNIVKELLRFHANPNIQNNEYDTPAHMAIKKNCIAIFKLLLTKGATYWANNKEGNTLLHLAILYKRLKIATFIIKHASKATLCWQNMKGNTPLHSSIKSSWNPIAIKLLSKRIHLNTQNNKGNTPLHIAVLNNNHEITRLLTKKGALYNIPNNYGKTALNLMN